MFSLSIHPNGCEVTPLCGMDLLFPDDKWCWTPFMCLLAICMYSLEKCLFKFSAQFLTELFVGFFFFFFCSWVLSSFYILYINCLPDTWFANIFSHSVGCLFTVFPLLCKGFLVWCNPTCLFCFSCMGFWCRSQENQCWDQCKEALSLGFLVGVLQFQVLLFSCQVVSDSLRLHGLQHIRLPCPSPFP